MGLARPISQLLLHNKWLKNSDTSNQRHVFSGTQVYWPLASRLTGWAQKLVLLGLPGVSLGPGLLLRAPGNGVMSAAGKSDPMNTCAGLPATPGVTEAGRDQEERSRAFQNVPKQSRLLWAPG